MEMWLLTLGFTMQLLLLLLPHPGFSSGVREPYRYDRYEGNPFLNRPPNLERN
ncbi:uncharacterized protein LOC128256675 [Drosophila gunungcola]|uniref:uncharacterized protein LOC128256675 n=1 Tax=Drosophila gunungcola TaxID=103775 RepID=UPI0022E39EFD|nr:uncharacterized protein LOC128256675 [Drosophila gunungcola]